VIDYRTAVDDIHITHESLARLCTDEYSTHVYKWEIGHEVKQVRGSQKDTTTLRERCEQKAEHCFEKLKDHQSASTFLSLLCALSIGLPACEAAALWWTRILPTHSAINTSESGPNAVVQSFGVQTVQGPTPIVRDILGNLRYTY